MLAKNLVWVFLFHPMEKPEGTYWPIQYCGTESWDQHNQLSSALSQQSADSLG